jgi:hypothetical protein
MTGLQYDIVTNASWINIRVSKILRLQMNNPIRNIVYQKIKQAGIITDSS